MKYTPLQLGLAPEDALKRVTSLELEVAQLQADFGYLTDIVQQAMLKSNPEFKKVSTLNEMDSFLRKRIGRPRSIKQNQG